MRNATAAEFSLTGPPTDRHWASPPAVVIYAEPLLSPSMTFVRSQASAMKEFAPLYVGPKHLAAGLSLPSERVVTIREGDSRLTRFKEIPFKVFHHDPFFFRRVRRFEPALVHAHYGPAALAALPLSRWLKVPLVATFHGSDVTTETCTGFLHRRYLAKRTDLQKGGDLFLAVSRFIHSRLLAQGFPPDKTHLHYIGVDTHFFSADPRVIREPIVLFVGRLEEVKGCEFAISAVAALQAHIPEIKLVVVGDGTQRARLQKLASQLVRHSVFTGFQSPCEVKRWMDRAKVLCLPGVRASSGAEEGFGLVVAEALSMGIPVVASRVGGIPEAIRHGITGFLTEPASTEDIAINLKALLTNQRLWSQFSNEGMRDVRARFDLERQTKELELLYQSILRRSE